MRNSILAKSNLCDYGLGRCYGCSAFTKARKMCIMNIIIYTVVCMQSSLMNRGLDTIVTVHMLYSSFE